MRGDVFQVTLDTTDLKRALAQLGTRAPQAIMRALNRTAQTVRTHAVRAVAQETKLPQKTLRPMLPVIRATKQHLRALVIARGRPIPLTRLGARQTGVGVVYRLGGRLQTIPSAFLATMPNARRPGVFRRTGKKRLPIERQHGPSIAAVVLARGIFTAQRDRAAQELIKHLAHESTYLLQRRARRA